jgi:Zn-dependent protease
VHLDLVAIVHALFFRVTWIPRLDVAPQKLRGQWFGALLMTLMASTVLAVFSALLLVLTPMVLTVLRGTAAMTITSLLIATSEMAIVTAVFNMVPIPPFVGAAYVPLRGRLAALWRGDALRWVCIVIFVLLSLAGVTARVSGPIRQAWRAWLGF